MSTSVTLYNPHPNQAKIHDSINKEPYKYYVINIGRQFGKSLLATNQILFWLLKGKCECAWVSPVYNQANKVYEQVVRAFAHSEGIIVKKDSQKLKIGFCNGSTLQFFSAERYDNIRGFTFDYLVCDEFAFMDEKAWTEVLRATVLVKGKKVLFISTPKGKNWFYSVAMRGYGDEYKQYKTFHATSFDTPFITQEELEEAKMSLPESIYKQEILAEFIDDGGEVFSSLKTNSLEAI